MFWLWSLVFQTCTEYQLVLYPNVWLGSYWDNHPFDLVLEMTFCQRLQCSFTCHCGSNDMEQPVITLYPLTQEWTQVNSMPPTRLTHVIVMGSNLFDVLWRTRRRTCQSFIGLWFSLTISLNWILMWYRAWFSGALPTEITDCKYIKEC